MLRSCSKLFQLRVLGFRSDEDGNIGVGVLPKREEILIRSFGPGLVARQNKRSPELQIRQRADGIQPHETAMIENLLKLGRRFRIPARGNESLTAHIGRVQSAKIKMIEVEAVRCELIPKSDLQPLHAVCGLAPG